MANPDNPLMRQLVNRFGTGLDAKADASGNHSLAQGLVDVYAQNGQKLPSDVVSMTQELNTLTQREVLLARTSPSARAALSGAGYDAVAVRSRAAELESKLYTSSADARNVGAKLDLQEKQVKLRKLEADTAFSEATLGGSIAATNAQNANSAASTQQSTDELAAAKGVRDGMGAFYQSGLDVSEAHEVFAANDPAMMQKTFGTTDRMAISRILQGVQVNESAYTTAMVTGMTDAARLSAYEISMDPQFDNASLQGMMNGSIPIPPGQTMLSLSLAMEDRTQAEVGQANFINAQAAGIKDQAELDSLVVGQLQIGDLANIVGMHIGTGTGMDAAAVSKQVADMVATGNVNDLAEALLNSTENGTQTVKFKQRDGSMAELPAMTIIEALTSRVDDQQTIAANRIIQNQQLASYAAQSQEVTRYVNTLVAQTGVPIPQDLQYQTQAQMSVAATMFQKAAVAKTDGERKQYYDAAVTAQQSAKTTMTDYMKASGAPDFMIEDVKQGRFMSESSHAQATLSAIIGGGAVYGNSALGNHMEAFFKGRQFTREQIISASNKGPAFQYEDLGLTQGEVVGAVSNFFITRAVETVSQALLTDPRMSTLPPAAQAQLAKIAHMDDVPMDKKLETISSLLTLADQAAVDKDNADVLAGRKETPTYKSGTIYQVYSQALSDPKWAQAAVTGSNDGTGAVTREVGALLTEFVQGTTKQPRYGAMAVAFTDLPAVAAKIGMDQLKQSGLSGVYYDRSRVVANTRLAAMGVFNTAGIYHGDVDNGDYADVQTAVSNIQMEDLVSPKQYKIFGQVVGQQANAFDKPYKAGIVGFGLDDALLGDTAPAYGDVDPARLYTHLIEMGRQDLAISLGLDGKGPRNGG
jgi:hypothetical protein